LDSGDVADWTLMGFLAAPDPAAFVLNLELRMDAVRADSRTCGGSVFVSTDDHPYRPSSGSSPGANGYLFLLRGNGDLDVCRVTEGVTDTLASRPGATAAPMGRYVPLRITITYSTIVFSRTDDHIDTVTVTDTTHRPVSVVHLGSTSARVRFKNLVLR
jgi:glycerophosphoryl diester phosphodiesterase